MNGVNWDLCPYFEAFNNDEMLEFKKDIRNETNELVSMASSAGPLTASNTSEWKEVVLKSESLFGALNHLASYVGCLCAADASREEYAQEKAAVDLLVAQAQKVIIQLKTAFKNASDEDFNSFLSQDKIDDLAFSMQELRTMAKTTMSAELENLAADLSTDGFSSWGRLYSTLAGKLHFEMKWPDGRVEQVPIAQCRSLMQDSDRAVRKAAFQGGNKAWCTVEDVCASALNCIAGTRLVLNEKRGVNHFLDVSLTQSRTSRPTLDAMFSAIEETRPFIQRIGKAKAKALGLQKLSWFDCEAPLAIPGVNRYSWAECVKIVEDAFQQAYPALADFFSEALERKWVESEPRAGKTPGAFCSSSSLIEESRIFMTYSGSLSDISTLAHEIGHGFHSRQLKGTRPLLRSYPMTLAETASTFAELILAEGVLEDPASNDAQKLNVLTGTINHCISFLIDIPIRFSFEKSLYEERSKGIVSVSTLKNLMKNAMRTQFGELMEDGEEDPMFWASKMHFYLTGISFYNYPYTFGYLLSRGIFEMFKQEGPDFLGRYEEFLKCSGTNMSHVVAQKTLGANLEEKDFWVKAILGHEREINLFEELAPKVL